MILRFESDGLELTGRLSKPENAAKGFATGLVLCHGFPSLSAGDHDIAQSYYDLADLISEQLGWTVFAVTFRGCGNSQGNFSLQGWLNDVINATEYLLREEQINVAYAAGFGTGGAMAINAASRCDALVGVAAVSPPSDFNDWIDEPEDLLRYARRAGVIRDPQYPKDIELWANELSRIQTVSAAEAMEGKPLLLVHGSDDRVVPSFDARVLADAHGSADLRIIDGATHRLRFDPRTTAVLIGWLDRKNRTHIKKTEPEYLPSEGK
ncbi:MAG: hypothetical protein CL431_01140 [Acidimicrobiaceae bacterium]|nr:hypothetical protein [Acidimicrobiaceae bacterium]